METPSIRRILASGIRQNPLPETKRTLKASLNGFTDWESLFERAHHHGVTALLWRNIKTAEISIPLRQRQLFELQAFRYRRAGHIRFAALSQILRALHREGVDAVVLKGGALAVLVYDDVGLRPMRDIDLLIKEADFTRAEAVLAGLGFRPEIPHRLLREHHHMVPLVKEVKGLTVQVELHRRLLPILPQYPKLDFSKVSNHLICFDCAGVPALSMDFDLMLWYVFIHGFRMPLWYEPYRLMHLADIVALVEGRFDEIDWERLLRTHPETPSVLAVLHQLCPFADNVRARLALRDYGEVAGVGTGYQGWPLRRFFSTKAADYPRLLAATLFPSTWWLTLYYSGVKKRSVFTLWAHHVGNIGRQIVLISNLLRINALKRLKTIDR